MMLFSQMLDIFELLLKVNYAVNGSFEQHSDQHRFQYNILEYTSNVKTKCHHTVGQYNFFFCNYAIKHD